MKISRLSTLVIAAVGLVPVTLAGTAGAAPPPSPLENFLERFETLDRNGDGRITDHEITQERTRWFADSDSDGNGVLSADEFKRAMERRRDEMFKRRLARMDADGDGRVTQEEFAKARWGMFARVDKNGDGALTRSEIEQNMRNRWQRR